MLDKLHHLVRHEIGEDRAPFDLDMFGAREGTCRTPVGAHEAETRH
jgi:hypothetical protein